MLDEGSGKHMEWTTYIKEAIRFIEEHLLEPIGPDDVATAVHISPLYLQRGFQIITGFNIAEYIRNRRLYEAGKLIISSNKKIIDISYEYGYGTPESFTKAFYRFHGMTPLELRKHPKAIHVFHPLHIEIKIKGGNYMEYVVEELEGFKVIGFSKEFSFENSYQEIPKFWDEIYSTYHSRLYSGQGPANALEQAIIDNQIGVFGICIDESQKPGVFQYMIAGDYQGGTIPEGLTVFEFPKMTWAKFKCVGPMPNALQEVNTRIFKEWLPGNKEYEIAGRFNIEWYSSEGDMQSNEYQSEIWIPVKEK